MPSFALLPRVRRFARSISTPAAPVSPAQPRVASPVTQPACFTARRDALALEQQPSTPAPRPHHAQPAALQAPPRPPAPVVHQVSPLPGSFPTAASDRRAPAQTDSPVLMARLNALNLSSVDPFPAVRSGETPVPKPQSPLSSSSASSASAASSMQSPLFRNNSYNARRSSSSASHPRPDPHVRALTDLPPMSPMSSMYDPHSPDVSADDAAFDDDSRRSARFSNSSTSDASLEANVFLRPRSSHENAPRTSDPRRPLGTPNPPSRLSGGDIRPPVPLRALLPERPASPSPIRGRPSLDSRANAIAGIAARGKAVDAFVANRPLPKSPASHDAHHDHAPEMKRTTSVKSLEMPRGKLQQLPPPRPVTPCHVPRPQTPSRLPRPRVFIKQSPSRNCIVDPVAVTCNAPNVEPGEAEFVTREIPRPTTPAPFVDLGSTPPPPDFVPVIAPLREEEFYFSDEEPLEDDTSDLRRDASAHPTPSDLLTSKVRRAVSALRSISFQAHSPEDLETAWGQTGPREAGGPRNAAMPHMAGSRWRRPRGRISSKNGVQEFECHSEADARSVNSFASNRSVRRDRVFARRGPPRGNPGANIRGDFSDRQKRSLWCGGRRDRQQSPQARAAELLLSNGQGLLAASSDPTEAANVLASWPPAEATEISDRARSNAKRCSVDKYVEFIHASAQRETQHKHVYKNLPSRMISKMFRRKRN